MAFYILRFSHTPNLAATVRLQSFCRGFSKLNIPTKVVYFFPDENFSKVTYSYSGIENIYYWEKFKIKNRFFLYLLYPFMVMDFIKKELKRGDKVLLYGMIEMVRLFKKKSFFSVYHEMTEYPTYGMGNRIYKISLKKYFKCCSTFDGIFVISTALKDLFFKNGIEENRINIINITVDASHFVPTEKLYDFKYIAYCGNALNKKDGVDCLIHAFSNVTKKYPTLKLVIIGQSPSLNENDQNIELIKSLGVLNNIVFTGRVESSDVPKILMHAEALVLARPDNEQARYGFPTKVGEYLMTAKPVIVSKVGDIPKFFTNGENALLVEPSDVNDLTEKIIWVLNNYDASIEIGQQGRMVALDNFDCVKECKKIAMAMNL